MSHALFAVKFVWIILVNMCFITRSFHDLVGGVLRDVLKRAGSTLRPSDILVFGWTGEHASVDLRGVSSLVGLRDNKFVVGPPIEGELGKVAKHEKVCAENQHVFIPFAFDTFGSLASEAVGSCTVTHWC
ncbi:hypothetical protein HanIR_Chr12g0589391 [Helianthus annuus]|nr:hypothetical protein HanIR_Chr12g0589391 [Helianthus annuus]